MMVGIQTFLFDAPWAESTAGKNKQKRTKSYPTLKTAKQIPLMEFVSLSFSFTSCAKIMAMIAKPTIDVIPVLERIVITQVIIS